MDVPLLQDSTLTMYLTHKTRKLVTLKETHSVIQEMYLNKAQIMAIIHNAWLINDYLHNLMLIITMENTFTNELLPPIVEENDNCV